MNNEEFYQYYAVNDKRTNIFVKNISEETSISKDAVTSKGLAAGDGDNYKAILGHMGQFKNIQIVVAGGFHLDIARGLKDKGASYLTITPNATQKHDEDVYSQMMTGNVNMQNMLSMQTSSLAPMLQSLGVEPYQVGMLLASLLNTDS